MKRRAPVGSGRLHHPGSAEIQIDGQPLPPIPDDDLPMNRRYFLM